MTNLEALQVLDQVGLAYQGTRKQHEMIVEAIKTLKKLIDETETKPAQDDGQ